METLPMETLPLNAAVPNEQALAEVPPSQPRDDFMLSEVPPEEEGDETEATSALPGSQQAGQSI
jgi:hypothetical protein